MLRKIFLLIIFLLAAASSSNAELIHLVDEHYVDSEATVFVLAHSNKDKFHSNKDLENLKYCKNLQVLDLAHGNLTDINFLSSLTELRILLLGANQIVDLEPLSHLQKLEYVELFKNKIKDISPLVGLTNLLDLNICFNKIKDFSPLYNLPKLERLWMYSSQSFDTRPQDSLVASLQNALPNILIDSTSYPTLGGWREHPRWYVIRNMTRVAMKWLPWESSGYTQDMVFVEGEGKK